MTNLDIYFSYEYGQLNEIIDHGTCIVYNYQCKYGNIRNMFIKREIPILINEKKFFDITTPYGYGGPMVLEFTEKDKLIDEYNINFTEYCIKNNIVSEFIRFHPLINNQNDFCKVCDTSNNRLTVAVKLTLKNVFMIELISECRNMIRKARNNHITIEFDFIGSTMNEFTNLYYETMKNNLADKYYLFPKSYFNNILKLLKNKYFIINAKLNNEIVSSAIFLFNKDFIHYHLSATDTKYYSFAPNNLIIWEAINWGINNNHKLLHLGGGLSNNLQDKLYKFKKSFSRSNDCNFYIGKKVYDKEIYDKLINIQIKNKDLINNKDYFPLYRA